MNSLRWLVGRIDRIADEVAGRDQVRVRQARLVLWVCVVLESQAVLFSLLYAFLGAPDVGLMVASSGVLLLVTPWLLRRSLLGAAHYETALLVLILDAISSHTGGAEAPALFWTGAAPLMASMTIGRRGGLVWLVVVGLNAAGFVGYELLVEPLDSFLGATEATVLSGIAVATLGFVAVVPAMVYESINDEMGRAVLHANREMRSVLDNVEEGLLTLDRRGMAAAQRSSALDRWFGTLPSEGEPVWRWLGGADERFAAFAAVAWESVFDDLLPLEVVIDQLPKRIGRDGKTFGIQYRPVVEEGGTVDRVLLVISDLTAEIAARKAELAQREQAALFARLLHDRTGFLQFWAEAQELLGKLRRGEPGALRHIHTLKGNAGCVGLESVAMVCHAVETRLAEERREPAWHDIDAIARAWAEATDRIAQVVAEEDGQVHIFERDLGELEAAIAARVEHDALSWLVAGWRCERTADALERLAEQAHALASRLGRGPIEVRVEDHGVRVDPHRWGPIWAVAVHAIRNAIDHGFEDPAVRASQGKPSVGTVRLATTIAGEWVVVTIADDGGGVKWDAVRRKAAALGWPHETEEDLHRALWSERLSTREEATETSGRGVGTSALAACVKAVGGRVQLRSEPGLGTTVELLVPVSLGAREGRPLAVAANQSPETRAA